MPRYNVERPDGKWACFSSVVDDYITKFMSRSKYERWRKREHMKNFVPLDDSNQMSFEEAEETREYYHGEDENDVERD